MTTLLSARALVPLLTEGLDVAGGMPVLVVEHTVSAVTRVLPFGQDGGLGIAGAGAKTLLAAGLLGLVVALLTTEDAAGAAARSVRRAGGRWPSGSAHGGWRAGACAVPTTRASRPS